MRIANGRTVKSARNWLRHANRSLLRGCRLSYDGLWHSHGLLLPRLRLPLNGWLLSYGRLLSYGLVHVVIEVETALARRRCGSRLGLRLWTAYGRRRCRACDGLRRARAAAAAIALCERDAR